MTADHTFPEDEDEVRFAELLKPPSRVPEMRGEFVQVLSQHLEAAFAARQPAPTWQRPMPSSNGHAVQSAEDRKPSFTPIGDAGVEVAAPQDNARTWRRWIKGSAAAAALVLVIAISSNPPAWAAMIRVLVQTITEFTIGGGNPGWQEQAVEDVPSIERPAPAPLKDAAPAIVSIDEAPRALILPATEPREVDPNNNPKSSEAGPHGAVNVDDWTPFAAPLPDKELTQGVDNRLSSMWLEQGIHPAEPANDAEFMRRVYLDLTGRIPSVNEAHEFLESASPNRRELLVDTLLRQRDCATHLAAIWRGILLPDEADLSRFGGPIKFEEWLAERFSTNVPYNHIVRELLLAEGRISESGPLLFYAALKLNPEELAGRTSRAFLGMRMECAQCHNHPFDSVTQHDFWSFAAFFARISRPRGKMEAASPVLRVHDNEQGEVSIPNSDEMVLPRLPQTLTDLNVLPDAQPRRQQLVDWLTSSQNGQFSRATVNRVWSHLFGRGMVEPVDDMRPANAAICPEVLDMLSKDFAASGFDLRRLIRALVLTKAYQLSSGAETDDPSRALCFAQMNIKSFTAEQLYDCISVATQPQALREGPTEIAGLSRFTDASRRAFIEQFRAPAGQRTDYQAGIPQALTLMHGNLIHSATAMQSSGLLQALSAPFFTDEQRLETMFLSTLSRYPEPAERQLMLQPLATATTEADRQQALGDVLWALLNSAEFSFNH